MALKSAVVSFGKANLVWFYTPQSFMLEHTSKAYCSSGAVNEFWF